jgi:hypothetical protein
MLSTVSLASKNIAFRWLQEPVAMDNAPSPFEEGLLDWLQRSTGARAREARRFLNFNLAALPMDCRIRICRALETSWRTAFFEMVVARTLQALGARLEYEVATASGSRPDFLAWFGDQALVVEATSPEFFLAYEKNRQHVGPLESVIREAAPAGSAVLIWELPEIGPAQSKREFKRVVAQLFRDLPRQGDGDSLDVERSFGNGVIRFKVVARRADHSATVEPGFSYWPELLDSIHRIRRAIKRKRVQVRDSSHSRLLAIAGRFGATSFSDFDRALFGDSAGGLRGEFMTEGQGEPAIAGVLVFSEVGFTCPSEPVLYLHPRFRGTLPTELGVFERRTVNLDSLIETTPSGGRRLLEALRPVDLSGI